MNNLPPISSPTGAPSPFPEDPNINLVALAQAQKWVMWAVLANISTVLMALFLQSLLSNPNAASASMLLLFNMLRLFIAIGVAISIWNLGRALKIKLAWLLAILSFLPLVGLVVLLVLNSRATTLLKAGGYKVGLMGAKL
ncbi:hypothetical protein EON83_08250 [bacterium]|nr:MAG: hypothetical protein EON83_08250 [bacterium]